MLAITFRVCNIEPHYIELLNADCCCWWDSRDDRRLVSQLYHESKTPIRNGNVEREDLEKFNALLDKLTDNKFFEYYGELGDYYQYLAHKYKIDSKSHTVDPATGE